MRQEREGEAVTRCEVLSWLMLESRASEARLVTVFGLAVKEALASLEDLGLVYHRDENQRLIWRLVK